VEAGSWTWLEVAKLVAGLFTPGALAILGIHIHRITKRVEHIQWRNQKLIEKRLAVYDELAPLLNDLLCYFTYVGCWKELDPPVVISMKRQVDKKVHLAATLFSAEWFAACEAYQKLCFEAYRGWGRDAALRTNYQRRQEARARDWNIEWNNYFSDAVSDPKAVRKAYNRVMEAFARDIGMNSAFSPPVSYQIPIDIR
jgi:hypothetical protein